MRTFLFVILAGLALPAAAAPVQPAPAQTKIDPATLKAADRMLTAMGYDRMMQRTSDAMVAQMGPMFRKVIEDKTGEAPDDALINRLTAIESDFLRGTIVNSPELRRAIATLYASKFSAAELYHLAGLYQDPVMHKWSEVSPDMTAQLVPLIHSVAETHSDELQQKIVTAITDYYAARKGASKS